MMKVFKIYALVLKKIKPRFHYCKKYEEIGKYCWTILKKVSYKQLKKKSEKYIFLNVFLFYGIRVICISLNCIIMYCVGMLNTH